MIVPDPCGQTHAIGETVFKAQCIDDSIHIASCKNRYLVIFCLQSLCY